MIRRKARMFLIAGAIVLVISVIASVSALAQTEPVQLAANTNAPLVSKPAAEITPSTSALQTRIDAQQQEINRLNALIERLEYQLEPVASSRAALPGTGIGFMPYPSPSPAPSQPPVSAGYQAPRELLPDIGQIGSELGFFVGGATNPYKDNKGFASGGYIDLPWKNVPGGKLSYEIMIGLQRSVTTTTSTSGVNALVNAAAWNYLCGSGIVPDCTGAGGPYAPPAATGGGLATYLGSPLPTVAQVVQERSKVLTVAPFELKYQLTKMGRFRPYGVAGVGGYVWIGSDNNTSSFDANKALGPYANATVEGSLTLGNLLNSLLRGSQIGGLAPTSPELAARGVPHGQGNVMFGGQLGGGFDIRISPRLSFGADFRHNFVEGKNSGFSTFAFKQGLNW